MTRNNHILAALICVLSLSACESRFELTQKDASKLIFLECSPGVMDTIAVRTGISVPITKYNPTHSQDQSLSLTSFHLMVNDEELRTEQRSSFHSIKNCIIAPCSLKEGDVISIEASANGTKNLHASTVVPRKPVLSSVEARAVTSAERDWLKIGMKASDVDEDGFYAVQVQNESVYSVVRSDGKLLYRQKNITDVDDVYDTMPHLDAFSIADMLFAFRLDYDGYSFGNSGSIILFTGKEIADDELSLYLSSVEDYGYTLDHYDDYGNPTGMTETTTYRNYYRVRLFSLSEEFYYYAKSLYLTEYSDMGGIAAMGLASATFTYTNLSSGLGVLGAVNYTDSEWMDNPFNSGIIDNPIYSK